MQHVVAGDLRIAFLEQGEGPLVVLLHGFPDTAYTWDRVQPAIAAAGYRVVAPFLRGYPPTEIRGPYDSDTLGADVLALATALGHPRFVLVGHDWGASAAFSAAGLAPDRLELLVTVAIPHPMSLLFRPWPRLLWAGRHFGVLPLPGMAARFRSHDLAQVDALVARWSPAWEVPPGETERAKEALRQPGAIEAALGYYRALRPWPTPAQRPRVRVPSVAFAGLHDNVRADDFERARGRYLDRYEVVRVPGGHFMHREHPEVFVRELLRVLPKP